MNQSNAFTEINKKKPSYWLRILFYGFLIYTTTILVFVVTSNFILIPTIVLVGNFLIPVVFVAFFFEKRNRISLNMASTTLCFFYGGVLGTITAALLEPVFILSLNFNTAFIVGIIEELTKLVGVYLIAKHRKSHTQLDGIILGAAAGMGFAAFESVGYAFIAFLQSNGSLTNMVLITLIRGIASPVGHGTWTAILAGVLFKESFSGRFNINPNVVGAYLLVVLLHGFWDGIPFIIQRIFPFFSSIILVQISIGLIGLFILRKQWKRSKETVLT